MRVDQHGIGPVTRWWDLDFSVEADGRIRVHRVVCVVDCGQPVNPLGIEAQIQGGIAYGLGAALHGAITFKDGRVQQSNFHDYPVLRMEEMPGSRSRW